MADGMITSKVELMTSQGQSYIDLGAALRKNIEDLAGAIDLLKASIGGKSNPALDASFAQAEEEILKYVPKIENVGQSLIDTANRHINEDEALAGSVNIELL